MTGPRRGAASAVTLFMLLELFEPFRYAGSPSSPSSSRSSIHSSADLMYSIQIGSWLERGLPNI